MNIAKATLCKEIDDETVYIYPKTTADMVDYSEQETVEDKLNNINTKNTFIDEKLLEIQNRISSIRDEVDALYSNNDQTSSSILLLQEKINAADLQIEQLREHVRDTIGNQISELELQIGNIDGTNNETQNALSNIQAQITDIINIITNLNTSLTEIETHISDVSSNGNITTTNLSRLQTQVDIISDGFNRNVNRIDDILNTTNDIQNTIGILTSKIDNILSAEANIANSFETMQSDIQLINDNIAEITSAQMSHETNINDLRSRITNAEINIEKSLLDETMYAKQLFMYDLEYASQSFARIKDDLFFAGFNKAFEEGVNPLIMIFKTYVDEDDGTMSIGVKFQTTDFAFGHSSSMAWSGLTGYVIDGETYVTDGIARDTSHIIHRVSMKYNEDDELNPENYTLTELDPILLPDNVCAYCLMNYDNKIYVYGRIDGYLCVWILNLSYGDERPPIDDTVAGIECYLSGKPKDTPRTEQDWSTDGKYIYHCYSNPNAVAIYSLATGEFIKLVNIGDFINGNSMIGEIEKICPLSDGTLYLTSQYYYPNVNYHNHRFWCVSKINFSSKMTSTQIHQYPNYSRELYVANTVSINRKKKDAEGREITVTKTFETNGRYQDGTKNYPFSSLASAIYAAMTTPTINNTIKIVNTGMHYTIDELVLRIPSLSLSIVCNNCVTFVDLHHTSGTLSITGAVIEKAATTIRSNLSLIDCIFNATYTEPSVSINNTNEDTIDDSDEDDDQDTTTIVNQEPPYRINGIINIINGTYTGVCPGGIGNKVFQFGAGAIGIVGFTNPSICPVSDENYNYEYNESDEHNTMQVFPACNNYQQLNLKLYNVINSGKRTTWTAIYEAPTEAQSEPFIKIGGKLPLNYSVLNNATYRIKWCSRDNDVWHNTIVNVNGVTTAELRFTTGDEKLYIRIMHLIFNPEESSIRVKDVREYVISNSDGNDNGYLKLETTTYTTETLFISQWKIKSIEVIGY